MSRGTVTGRRRIDNCLTLQVVTYSPDLRTKAPLIGLGTVFQAVGRRFESRPRSLDCSSAKEARFCCSSGPFPSRERGRILHERPSIPQVVGRRTELPTCPPDPVTSRSRQARPRPITPASRRGSQPKRCDDGSPTATALPSGRPTDPAVEKPTTLPRWAVADQPRRSATPAAV